MTDLMDVDVRRVAQLTPSEINALADVLIDCIASGASVGFMLPFGQERARAFWQQIAVDVAAGRRALIVAEDAHGICGTVQVVLAQPENQPHRGDIAKMLVHRRARRRGVGAKLMVAAEQTAASEGKSVLVLDTASDDAVRLYERSGWTRVGVVPAYALLPGGGYCDTIFFHRRLDA